MAMLRVDLRRLTGEPVVTSGTIAPDDPAFEGLAFAFSRPVGVEGVLTETVEGDFFWRGHVHAMVQGECRRCLEPVEQVIDDDIEALFSANPELLDDPSVYALPDPPTVVDVPAALREEIALRVSAFPLCRPDCKGLCVNCGADLNAGPCGCTASGTTN